ncbi:MAG: V-type ATP synthase subunit I, partial [Clostridia bacterium]|nr:V-type ATP synthase subunit I [Clostridia bacterium]
GGSIFVDVPAVAVNVGLYVAIVGVVGIILFSSRESKSIIGRLGGGLYALYNNVSGYLSDILSYSRLLALGLATGSIAEVINMMGTLPENKTAKAILLVVVFILGHALNMAINLLGAYVHTVRLQFVELLPKFYEGGGRAMRPFAMNTKYFRVKNNSKITKSGKEKSVGENTAG